jgi:hypothetical protein
MTGASLNPNGRLLRNLSERQREAIEWLAAGHPPDEVAVLLHVAPAVIRKWLRGDLMFRAALAIRRSNPSPPIVDPLKSILRRIDTGEAERPWTSEESKEE